MNTPIRHLAPVTAVLLLLTACGDRAVPSTEEVAATTSADSAVADEVRIDSAAAAEFGIRVDTVASVSGEMLSVTGSVTYDANLVSHIGSRAAGRILTLRADIGDQVTAGSVLAILESPEVGEVRSDELEAEALLEIAQENFNREQRLEQQGISSRKELLDAKADLRRAEAALRSSRERLRVLGAGHGSGGEFGLTAPFAGVVVERGVSRGEMVGPEDQLFVVADLRQVWVLLDIFERDLPTVARGQQVLLTTTAWPDREFTGQIVHVGAVLDSATRTVRARIEVPNRDGALRPGMFATAVIAPRAGGQAFPVVPQDAVQELEGRKVVFVPGEHPGEFVARTVLLGRPTGGTRVMVLSGLKAGEQVVVAGAFMLRSELAKGEIGEHGH